MGRLTGIAAEIGTADQVDEPLVTVGIRCQDDPAAHCSNPHTLQALRMPADQMHFHSWSNFP